MNWGQRSNLRFGITTDDRPFSYDLFRPAGYFTLAFWQRALGTAGAFERYRAQQLLFVGAIAILGTILILGPLLVNHRVPRELNALPLAVFFAAIGVGFMLFEIGLMQKAVLLLGNPGLSIALVLAALVLFAGVGSLASRWLSARWLPLRTATIAMLVYGGWLAAGPGDWLTMALEWPILPKCIWLIALIAPAGLLMGQFLPQGLARARREDTTLVAWGWAINGVAGTVAAGAAQVLVATFGIRAVMLAGVLCYSCVLFLPGFSRDRHVRDAAA